MGPFNFFEYEETKNDDEDDDFFDDITMIKDESLDIHDLMSFLNEYYLVYPDQLPKKELF
jgi:hypothetical protein